jgi:sugar/nucleoside kinase (ribokinase family)
MVMSKPVICIGSALVDELFHAAGEILLATTSNAIIHRTAGGVARNIAHQLALLDVPVQLISVFGKDKDGEWLSAGIPNGRRRPGCCYNQRRSHWQVYWHITR